MTNAGKIEEATGKHTPLPDLLKQEIDRAISTETRLGMNQSALNNVAWLVIHEREALYRLFDQASAYPQLEAMRKALEEAKASILEIQSLARKIDSANEDSGFNIANIILSCDMASADLEAAIQPLKKEAE